MNKLFLLPLTFLAFAIAVEANTASTADSNGDGEWRLDNYSGFPTDTMASVNGNAVYGDRLRVKFSKGRCEKGYLFTTIYTYKNHPDLLKLKNQSIRTQLNGVDFSSAYIAQVIKPPKATGHSATIVIGALPKEGLIVVVAASNPFTIEYLDSEKFKASDYFDVLENSWNSKNARIAIEQAYNACKLL